MASLTRAEAEVRAVSEVELGHCVCEMSQRSALGLFARAFRSALPL